jgi:hypothetical protein
MVNSGVLDILLRIEIGLIANSGPVTCSKPFYNNGLFPQGWEGPTSYTEIKNVS